MFQLPCVGVHDVSALFCGWLGHGLVSVLGKFSVRLLDGLGIVWEYAGNLLDLLRHIPGLTWGWFWLILLMS